MVDMYSKAPLSWKLMAIGLLGTTTAFVLRKYWRQLHYASNLQKVGEIAHIFAYPIKSCRGVSVMAAECTSQGLKCGFMRDRVFLLITSDGVFVTSRQEHSMLLIVPRFEEDVLLIDAPNMPTLKLKLKDLNSETPQVIKCKVWGQEVDGCYCGDEAARWFQQYLGKSDYKLVYFRQDFDPKFAKKRKKYEALFKDADKAAYADLTPYLLMTMPSIENLNTRLDNPVGVRNFRPNLVVRYNQPYEEDTWTNVKIGSQATFRNVKPCQRCLLTTIDPETGIKTGEEPLKTLKSYRQTKDTYMKQFVGESALLGVGLCVDTEGWISVGDPVYAKIK